jgi:hypothetical protein
MGVVTFFCTSAHVVHVGWNILGGCPSFHT